MCVPKRDLGVWGKSWIWLEAFLLRAPVVIIAMPYATGTANV